MESFNLLVAETTEQELFDHVCKHLSEQKKPAKRGTGGCAYRLGVLSCAIGGCFSEDYYDETMDEGGSTPADEMIWRFFPEAEDLINLANDLQNSHDSHNDIDTLITSLSFIAQRYGLKKESINLIKEWEHSA